MQSLVFWYWEPCAHVEIDRRFRGAYCLHHHRPYFWYRKTLTNNMRWHCCCSSYCFLLLCWQKELLLFELHIRLRGQYSILFPLPHCEKLNLNFTEVYIIFEKRVIHSWTLCHICLYCNVLGVLHSLWNFIELQKSIHYSETQSATLRTHVHVRPARSRNTNSYRILPTGPLMAICQHSHPFLQS
jgi:hypothetical protein